MPTNGTTINLHPGMLTTVAFLKARLDEGDDHLGIFMPLVLDVLATSETENLTTKDVQEAVANRHGLAVPLETVTTLLKRAARQRYLRRESGIYSRNRAVEIPSSNVTREKARIADNQRSLAEALRKHAGKRGLALDSIDAALDLLLKFLQHEQIALLLGEPPGQTPVRGITPRDHKIVAEFIHESIRDDSGLKAVLERMLEGLVLYHSAFLPDLDSTSRRFRNLHVLFDSNLVRQALGYEGTAMKARL